MMFYDFTYLLFIAPAIILSLIAQWMIRSAYVKGQQSPASLSGYAAARKILDAAGLTNVQIEQVPGEMSDHYDPRDRVLRLSSDVYHGRHLTAVGIAAHEAGHALQHAFGYIPLVLRNLAVPAASFGSGVSWFLIMAGILMNFKILLFAGIVFFSFVVIFQVINLPVEFNASSRAKQLLVEHGIVNQYEMGPVNKVLNAAALTYVAATLHSVMTLLYYILRYSGRDR